MKNKKINMKIIYTISILIIAGILFFIKSERNKVLAEESKVVTEQSSTSHSEEKEKIKSSENESTNKQSGAINKKIVESTSSSGNFNLNKETRVVSTDGYTEISTFDEFYNAITSKVSKIRLTHEVVFTKDVIITSDITIDFNGLKHNFKSYHIFINEIPKSIHFENFNGTGSHPGGITANINENALIVGYATAAFGVRYHFTGIITFTGSFDVWDGSRIGTMYLPQATVVMDGVSGNIDMQPIRTGLTADPGKAYFCRAYRLEVINGSNLIGPNLGKFYGRLTDGSENAVSAEGAGLFMSGGSTVNITYDSEDSVSDEGEAVDVLPNNVTLSLTGKGTQFKVDTKVNITNDNNRGIIQMRGEKTNVIVSEGAELTVNSKTTAAIRLQGTGSTIQVLSGGKLYAKLEGDNDISGNNVLRLAGSGMSVTVDGVGSELHSEKMSGRSAAILFENGNQKFSVTNKGALFVHNVGNGKEYANRVLQGNQAVLFAKTDFWGGGGTANFTVTGEQSNIDMRADSGSVIDTTGSIDLEFSASIGTYLVMVGKTGADKTGIISGDKLTVNFNNPTYFDLQNKRIGTTAAPGGWVFQGNGDSSVSIAQSEIALWRKNGALFSNFDKDPNVFSDLTDLSLNSTDLGTFVYSSSSILNTEFNATGSGMKNYNRISANNQIPIVDSLRVPTNADKKIYGHVAVPEGVNAKPRDAWTDEVQVTLRITYADVRKSPVEITATTKGQQSGTDGYNPWGEGVQGGLFEIKVPNDEFLSTGDKIEVIDAKKVRGGQKVTQIDTGKTTVDIIPPSPAVLNLEKINVATKTISGTGDPGSSVSLVRNGEAFGETTLVDLKGKFTVTIPENALNLGDEIEVFLNDNSGDASTKGVINKPITNNNVGNTQPSKTSIIFHDAAAFEPAPILATEGGLFMSIPTIVAFDNVKANGLSQESVGNINESLVVYDQREIKNTWKLSVKQTKAFTDNTTEMVLDNILYFAKNDSEYKPVILNESLDITTGKNTDNTGKDYSSLLQNNKGFKVIVPKEQQKVGDYSSEITWTLADVPTGG